MCYSRRKRDEYNGSSKSKTYDLVYIAVFAVLMAVCSWISVPTAVPFTLQTFAVFMAVGVLGGRRGTMSVALYIILGAVGVPVFAGMTGGIGILTGTTGGYIVGFLFSALVMWAMEKIPGKKCNTDFIYGCGPDCMLCFWYCMVYGCVYENKRSGRPDGGSWMVCDTLYYSGHY